MLSVKKFSTVTTKDSGNKDSMGSVDLIQNLFYLTQMLVKLKKTHLQTCMCKQFEAILD